MAAVRINGRPHDLESTDTVQSLLKRAGYRRERRLIVERNGEPLPAEMLAETKVKDGDRLEVVQLVGGG